MKNIGLPMELLYNIFLPQIANPAEQCLVQYQREMTPRVIRQSPQGASSSKRAPACVRDWVLLLGLGICILTYAMTATIANATRTSNLLVPESPLTKASFCSIYPTITAALATVRYTRPGVLKKSTLVGQTCQIGYRYAPPVLLTLRYSYYT